MGINSVSLEGDQRGARGGIREGARGGINIFPETRDCSKSNGSCYSRVIEEIKSFHSKDAPEDTILGLSDSRSLEKDTIIADQDNADSTSTNPLFVVVISFLVLLLGVLVTEPYWDEIVGSQWVEMVIIYWDKMVRRLKTLIGDEDDLKKLDF